ncbi:MAG: prepilin-type N-terminal cleavage/methylation domain-containing protein [Deltaproteobacteria bacterium]|nr:prepilin-type N-terminal cleavage/methylation domain-containing protein [Deltaproteobacteria bacterium]
MDWPRSRRTRSQQRGFTLIELMVAAGIALVILGAATAVFAGIETQRIRSERQLAVTTAAATAFLMIQRDVQNAGFNFATPLFAVRVLDAPASVANGDGSFLTATAGCGSGGLVAGTDVLEIVVGAENRLPGGVTSATGTSNPIQVSFQNSNPFGAIDAGQPDRVVLFGSTTIPGRACIGRVAIPALGLLQTGSNFTTTVNMVNRDYVDLSGTATTYPNCPAQMDQAWMIGRRIRYMVCSTPSETGLFRQETTRPDGWFTGTAVLVQENIEDFQVGVKLRNNDGAITGGNADCDCSGSPAPPSVGASCFCGVVANQPLTTAAEPVALSTLDETVMVSRINGLRIGILASRATPTSGVPTAAPDVLNHPPGPVGTVPMVRALRVETVNLPNLTLVSM